MHHLTPPSVTWPDNSHIPLPFLLRNVHLYSSLVFSFIYLFLSLLSLPSCTVECTLHKGRDLTCCIYQHNTSKITWYMGHQWIFMEQEIETWLKRGNRLMHFSDRVYFDLVCWYWHELQINDWQLPMVFFSSSCFTVVSACSLFFMNPKVKSR